MYSASLIIPIYNEEQNIENLFNEILINDIHKKVEYIVFVNDFSTDNSLKKLIRIKESYKNIKIIKHSKNLGQSSCILSGAKSISSETIITIDGDGQNNPKDINQLLKIYFENPDVYLVGGIRVNRKDSLIKIISSRIANKVRKFIFNDNCDDTGCSLKILDRRIFLNFPFFHGIHRFLPALFSGMKLKTIFIPVDHRPRKFGKSKYRTLSRLIFGIIDIYRVLVIIKKFN